MLDNDTSNENTAPEGSPAPASESGAPATDIGGTAEQPVKKAAAKRTAAKKTTTAKKAAAKKAPAKRTSKKAAAAEPGTAPEPGDEPQADSAAPAPAAETPAAVEAPAETAAVEAPAGETAAEAETPEQPAKKATARKSAAKKTTAKKTAAKKSTAKKGATASVDEAPALTTPVEEGQEAPAEELTAEELAAQELAAEETPEAQAEAAAQTTPPAPVVLFKAPDKVTPARRKKAAAPQPAAEQPAPEQEAAAEEQPAAKRTRKRAAAKPTPTDEPAAEAVEAPETETESAQDHEGDLDEEQGGGGNRRRRRRGGRRRRKGNGGEDGQGSEDTAEEQESPEDEDRGAGADKDQGEGSATSRRRRRRRRSGDDGDGASDDPENTVVRVRKPRNVEDEITALQGSTRLEAKKQRRREGREAGRRRAPIVSEAEFLARREAVDRVMVIRQRKDLTQIAVLEDKVLVEHYVARESQTSLIGNVYLGRVQNVLPSMEAAFIDIGKGRNAVLYAGEVNWDSLGAGNGPRKIEQVLKSGQSVLVQVTKDPIGHKGARLTSQISLPGRFLVYVPDGTTSGISRKLPDTERNRLKTLLKEIVPDTAGVIVRTAAEGASEDELTRDVERLRARWDDIAAKVDKGNAPQLLYGEPDLTLKVVRDLFTEDFGKLVVSGDDAWDMVDSYVEHVAPDLADRLEKYDGDQDVFAAYRIDEQIDKALDRKVWLPSGGSLIIDRTEAMTVVDVNTGKFTGSGGNLEETVTKNNLEAAEEIVRQLRLRDIGGIIVVDFIDMVLESNRDLVLRRLVECLGRDRTRHQVAEVTSLGLVQMTRKRIGTGLLEAFSESCEHCQGRGLILHHEPIEPRKKQDEEPRRGRRGRGRKDEDEQPKVSGAPTPKDIAAMARHEQAADEQRAEEQPAEAQRAEEQPAEGAVEATAVQVGEPADGVVEQPARSTRRRRGRGGAQTEEAGQAAEAARERSTEERTEQPTEQPQQRQQEPAVEEAPRAPEPAPEQPAPAEQPAATEQPAEEPSPEEEAAPPAPPAAPRIVTSTRRRVARRPAGPPSGAAVAGNGSGPVDVPAVQTAEPAPAGSADGEGTPGGSEPVAAAHVPVKKKGSRKR